MMVRHPLVILAGFLLCSPAFADAEMFKPFECELQDEQACQSNEYGGLSRETILNIFRPFRDKEQKNKSRSRYNETSDIDYQNKDNLRYKGSQSQQNPHRPQNTY